MPNQSFIAMTANAGGTYTANWQQSDSILVRTVMIGIGVKLEVDNY